jgi:hypothetical protein
MGVKAVDAVHDSAPIFVLPNEQFPCGCAVGLGLYLPIMFMLIGCCEHGPLIFLDFNRRFAG